jgi:hypothetical protein
VTVDRRNYTISDNQADIRLGFFFPLGGLVFGGLCFLFATGILLTKDINAITISVSAFLCLFGLTFFSTRHLLIDKSTGQILELTKCFGLVFKSAKDLNKFKFVSTLRQLYGVTSKTVFSPDVESKFFRYDVVLLNSNHLVKYKLHSLKSLDSANEFAKDMSAFLNYDIVKFDPKRTKR